MLQEKSRFVKSLSYSSYLEAFDAQNQWADKHTDVATLVEVNREVVVASFPFFLYSTEIERNTSIKWSAIEDKSWQRKLDISEVWVVLWVHQMICQLEHEEGANLLISATELISAHWQCSQSMFGMLFISCWEFMLCQHFWNYISLGTERSTALLSSFPKVDRQLITKTISEHWLQGIKNLMSVYIGMLL